VCLGSFYAFLLHWIPGTSFTVELLLSLPRTPSGCISNLASPLQIEVSVEKLSGADEGIAVISMNRPSVKNAIGKNFLSQLESSIYSLKHSSARVVILRSLVDKTFCAGADLKVCVQSFKFTNF